ncbi:MAG: DNA methyltransferase, partial [Chloroflexota bacterium]
ERAGAVHRTSGHLSQDVLDIENKVRSNLFGWRGQFSPQLVEALLRAYAPQDAFILDPFVGSGTVLYEAGHLGLRALGTEINPAAGKLAQIYQLINKDRPERKTILNNLESSLTRLAYDDLPLFTGLHGNPRGSEVEKLLVALHRTLVDPETRALLETLIVSLDFHAQPVSTARLASKWKDLKKLVMELPYAQNSIALKLCDARALPLENSVVDLVITSPPYINVFNYHQQYRGSAEAMGWRALEVAKSEIGSNRKHRQNRFLTVIQYCLDIAAALRELKRVSKPAAEMIFVIGRESNVRKTAFFNGQIIEGLAIRCAGLKTVLKQERAFKNKFGAAIREEIITFGIPSGTNTASLDNPRVVARDILQEAAHRAPAESLRDLRFAIDAVDVVRPSPIFKPLSANPLLRSMASNRE